ncbi:MAG: hypothetical protein R3C49_17660 [Planctomycetaceae bacterium]
MESKSENRTWLASGCGVVFLKHPLRIRRTWHAARGKITAAAQLTLGRKISDAGKSSVSHEIHEDSI